MQNPMSACPHCGAQISANARFWVVSLYRVQGHFGHVAHDSPHTLGWHTKTEQLVHRPNVIGQPSSHSRCALLPFLG